MAAAGLCEWRRRHLFPAIGLCLLNSWNSSAAACSLKKKSSHGGHGVHGVIFGEARLRTGIKRLING